MPVRSHGGRRQLQVCVQGLHARNPSASRRDRARHGRSPGPGPILSSPRNHASQSPVTLSKRSTSSV